MNKRALSTKKSSIQGAIKNKKPANVKMLTEIIENSRIGVFRTTIDGKILFCNSALITLLGYKSFQDIKNIDLRKDLYKTPDERNKLIERLKKEKSIEKSEVVLISKKGQEITALFSIKAKSDKRGIKYLDGFIEDISALKQNEVRIVKVNEYLKILNDINISLSEILNFDELLDKCMKVILMHFSGNLGGVLYIVQDEWLVPEAYYPEDRGELFFPIKIGSSDDYGNLSSWVYNQKKEIVANNTHNKKFLDINPSFKKEHAHSFAIFPVISGEKVIGVMNIFCEDVKYFNHDMVKIFRGIVAQLAVYLHNAVTYLKTRKNIDEAKKKLEEVNLCYQISNRLAGHIEFDKIINECFSILKEQKFASAKIYLTSEDNQSLNLLSYYDETDIAFPREIIENGKFFSGLAALKKTPIIINDSHDIEAISIDPDLKTRAKHSFASLPIIYGNKCLGVINISATEPNKFRKSTISFCDAISGQLAFVLNNAVLHSQMLKKNHELVQLYNTINRLSKHIEIKDIITEAFDIFKEMGFVCGKIYKVSADNTYLELLSSYFNKEGKILKRIKIGESFSGEAAEKLHVVVVNDSHDAEILKKYPEFANLVRHSFATFPLEYQNKCIGVLSVVGLEVGKFTPEILNLCTNIVKQLALLLNNSEIHDKTIKRYQEVTLLYDITKRLSLHISLNEIVTECFEFFRDRNFTDGKLYLNNNDNLELFALYSNSKVIPDVPKNISEGNYFSSISYDTGNPIIINSTHSNLFCDPFPEMINIKEHSIAVFPIIYGDNKLGVLNLACDEPQGFDEFTINLVTNITHHLGVLINNSKLYEEVVRKNQDLRILNELSQELNKKMNLDEGSRIISKKLEELFDYDGFYIDIYDSDTDTMSNVINIDILDGEKKYFKGQQNRVIKSELIRKIISEKEPVLLLRENENDKIYNLSTFGDVKRRALSLMYSPLYAKNEILGILAVHSYKKNAFNKDDLSILNGIANYISITIKNILLYKHLSDSENRYKTLIKNAPEAIYSFDAHGICTAVNSRMCEFLKKSEMELIGKYITSFLPDSMRKYFVDKFRGIQDRETPVSFELKTEDGKYYDNTIMPIFGEENVLEYFVGITRDITMQKEAEENNIKVQQQLSENKKHEFIVSMTRNIAHVFNNVLVNVLSRSSFAKTLVEKDSIIYPHLEKIELSSKRVGELVKQLLTFAQSGNYLTEALDLNKIIQFFFYSKKPQIKSNINIQLALSEKNPIVISNRDQLIVMLDKIFTNSIEAVGEKGTITFTSGIIDIKEQKFLGSQNIGSGTYGKFSIIDDGCGIREDIKNRFFEPFNTTKEYGRGLGLPSVFGIILNMNGFLNVISEIDKGTEVEIYLPLEIRGL
jgi:PAS domain S-box-containing protein